MEKLKREGYRERKGPRAPGLIEGKGIELTKFVLPTCHVGPPNILLMAPPMSAISCSGIQIYLNNEKANDNYKFICFHHIGAP